jgi:hypothetical protein
MRIFNEGNYLVHCHLSGTILTTQQKFESKIILWTKISYLLGYMSEHITSLCSQAGISSLLRKGTSWGSTQRRERTTSIV